MESEARLGRSLEFVAQQVQVQAISGGSPTPPAMGSTLPQPIHTSGSGQVMTDEQMETLRRQISVYSTICQQLVEMHKACLAQQPPLPGIMIGGQLPYDQMGTPNHKPTTRLRWTPSQIQLQILERLFEQGNGTPNKQHIKEITDELRRHGQITETNVYNWFQNRKARAKRRHQQVSVKDGESEADTDADSPRQKRQRQDRELTHNESENFGDANGISSDGGNGGATETSSVTMVDDISKPWEAAVDANGKGTLLGDSQGQIIATSEGNSSLHPVQIEERYSLAGGPVPSMDESRKGPEKGQKEVQGTISTFWNFHTVAASDPQIGEF
ncbi:unnamed protein product [Sphagnum balticum]